MKKRYMNFWYYDLICKLRIAMSRSIAEPAVNVESGAQESLAAAPGANREAKFAWYYMTTTVTSTSTFTSTSTTFTSKCSIYSISVSAAYTVCLLSLDHSLHG